MTRKAGEGDGGVYTLAGCSRSKKSRGRGHQRRGGHHGVFRAGREFTVDDAFEPEEQNEEQAALSFFALGSMYCHCQSLGRDGSGINLCETWSTTTTTTTRRRSSSQLCDAVTLRVMARLWTVSALSDIEAVWSRGLLLIAFYFQRSTCSSSTSTLSGANKGKKEVCHFLRSRSHHSAALILAANSQLEASAAENIHQPKSLAPSQRARLTRRLLKTKGHMGEAVLPCAIWHAASIHKNVMIMKGQDTNEKIPSLYLQQRSHILFVRHLVNGDRRRHYRVIVHGSFAQSTYSTRSCRVRFGATQPPGATLGQQSTPAVHHVDLVSLSAHVTSRDPPLATVACVSTEALTSRGGGVRSRSPLFIIACFLATSSHCAKV